MENFSISCVADACSFTTPESFLQLHDSALMSELQLHSTTPGWTEIPNITSGFPDGVEVRLNFNRPGGFDSMFHIDSAAPTADELVPVTFEATCAGQNCAMLPETAVLPAAGTMRVNKTAILGIITDPSLIPYAERCLYSPIPASMKSCSLFAPLWVAIEEKRQSSKPDSDLDKADDSAYKPLVARGGITNFIGGQVKDQIIGIVDRRVQKGLWKLWERLGLSKRTLGDSDATSPDGHHTFPRSQEIAKGNHQFTGEYISNFVGIMAPELAEVLFPPGWNGDREKSSFITVDEFYLEDATAPGVPVGKQKARRFAA